MPARLAQALGAFRLGRTKVRLSMPDLPLDYAGPALDDLRERAKQLVLKVTQR